MRRTWRCSAPEVEGNGNQAQSMRDSSSRFVRQLCKADSWNKYEGHLQALPLGDMPLEVSRVLAARRALIQVADHALLAPHRCFSFNALTESLWQLFLKFQNLAGPRSGLHEG